MRMIHRVIHQGPLSAYRIGVYVIQFLMHHGLIRAFANDRRSSEHTMFLSPFTIASTRGSGEHFQALHVARALQPPDRLTSGYRCGTL